MQAPLQAVRTGSRDLRALGITDSFTISFHLAFYAGIVLCFPILLYFLAEFVLPALTAVEKRILLPAILVSFALFLFGVLACYYWLLPKTILFFFRTRNRSAGSRPGRCRNTIRSSQNSRWLWAHLRAARGGAGAGEVPA